MYNHNLARGLRTIFKRHEALFEGIGGEYQPELAANCRTIRDFDDAITRVSFGWPSVDAYYAGSGSDQVLCCLDTHAYQFVAGFLKTMFILIRMSILILISYSYLRVEWVMQSIPNVSIPLLCIQVRSALTFGWRQGSLWHAAGVVLFHFAGYSSCSFMRRQPMTP